MGAKTKNPKKSLCPPAKPPKILGPEINLVTPQIVILNVEGNNVGAKCNKNVNAKCNNLST